jgi:hypothetical protein
MFQNQFCFFLWVTLVQLVSNIGWELLQTTVRNFQSKFIFNFSSHLLTIKKIYHLQLAPQSYDSGFQHCQCVYLQKLFNISSICNCVQLLFQSLILHTSNTKLTVHKGEPIPWLQLFPFSIEGSGGGLGGVSVGRGGINLQLSSAGRKVTALSATEHG